MSAGLAARPRLFRDLSQPLGRAGASALPPDSSGGGRLTLEEHLDSVWEGLCAGGAAECPVCHARMGLAPGASAAHCGGCGSQLS